MPKFPFLPSLLLLACLLAPCAARAYDEDTHFYGTYAMARHAGIKHEVAVKIALSAQWMDESFISDPTSMIFMPVTGIKKRRLLHFPSSRISGAGGSSAQRQIFGMDDLGEFTKTIVTKVAAWAGYDGDLDDINFFTETREDHPFGSQMLSEGLKEGNLMKAATGIHTMEDSFAHAGTPAEQGHALFWHWPDRPYASVDKYQRMVHSVMTALVAIRTMLPPEARDCALKTAGATPNCQADPEMLANSYIPLVLPVYSHDMMRDPEYVRVALGEFFSRATGRGYTKMTADQFRARVARINLVDGKTDAYSALQLLLLQIFADTKAADPTVFDFGKVLEDMGRIQSAGATEVQQYIDNFGRDGVKDMRDDALKNFAHVVATELLAWHVPTDLTDSHRMEIEDDKDEVRKAEIDIRVRNMQAFIRKNFNVDIIFVGNNTINDVGFYKEIHMDPSAEPDFSAQPGFQAKPGAVYATFSLREKNAFDNNILKYLFPEMKPEEVHKIIEGLATIKKALMERSAYYAELKKVNETYPSWWQWLTRRREAAKLDAKYKRFRDISLNLGDEVEVVLKDLKPLAKPLIHDLVTSHQTPSEDVFFYRRSKVLDDYATQGKVKPFLSDSDVWSVKDLLKQNDPAAPASFWNNLF